MTAKNVTNNTDQQLGIGGNVIRPGATARVENWERIERSSHIQTLIRQELITVKDGKAPLSMPGLPPMMPTMTEDEEIAAIKAELTALGVTTNATKLDTLRKKLAEVKGG